MKTYWTIGGAIKSTSNGEVNLMPGTFETLTTASMAWERAGKPQARGSSVHGNTWQGVYRFTGHFGLYHHHRHHRVGEQIACVRRQQAHVNDEAGGAGLDDKRHHRHKRSTLGVDRAQAGNALGVEQLAQGAVQAGFVHGQTARAPSCRIKW